MSVGTQMKNNQTKKCTKCQQEKILIEFASEKNGLFGIRGSCKKCDSINRLNYRRTRRGVIGQMFDHQTATSKRRNHGKQEYSKLEFTEWILKQENFHIIFKKWEDSGYKKMEKPSCDRHSDTDERYDKLPYSLKRLRVVTWQENFDKGHKDMRIGRNKTTFKPQKPTIQMTIKGCFIKEFISRKEASRQLNISVSGIASCCSKTPDEHGKVRKSAGGFTWRNKNES